jgi:Peptidase C13 family
MAIKALRWWAALMLPLAAATSAQEFDRVVAARKGWSMEQNRSPRWHLAQQKRLSAALAALQPQRAGVVDAYIVSLALDSDPVFGREATESAKILSRRYQAGGRTLVMTAHDDEALTGPPQASPPDIAAALAGVAAKMNLKEDVLILFATTHGGADVGLVYRDTDKGFGMIAPVHLAAMLDGLGIERRMIILSACFSGVFLNDVAKDNSVVVTAAAADRTSFGCEPGNDWTFFGDAFLNTAMRKSQPVDKAAVEAITLINQWELARGLEPSMPQVHVGSKAAAWLTPLDARVPKLALAPVGKRAAGN